MPAKSLFNYHSSILALVIFSLISCRSGTLKNSDDIQAPSGYKIPPATQLVSAGENMRGRFSASGSKILFISRDRSKHEQPQVYELDLASQSDRRITFQDGEILDVIYAENPNEFLYSSTTDEIKENPEFIRLALNKGTLATPTDPVAAAANPAAVADADSAAAADTDTNFLGEILARTEIYMSTLDGRNIRRLTESKGFDGEISSSPVRPEIAFISTRKSVRGLYVLNTKSNHLTQIKIGKDESDSVDLSRSGKEIVWTRKNALTPTEIWTSDLAGKKSKKVMGDAFENLEPTWTPNGEEIIFSSNRDGNIELYVAMADGTCIRRLTYNSAQDRHGNLSPDGKKLLFSSNRSGKWQLYLTDYSPPPCPVPAESLQSNP